jgi:predicted enzyme related to lactoylglutathione lyase
VTHKIEGHEAFFYYTSSMQAGVSFYRDIIGLIPISIDDYWSVFLLPDNGRFALHLADEGKPAVVDGPAPMLVLRVQNVRDSLEYLQRHGVKVMSPYVAQPWGEEADVSDPDGNRLRIARLARA